MHAADGTDFNVESTHMMFGCVWTSRQDAILQPLLMCSILYLQTKMKRRAVGIWHCGSCKKTVAGGAWTYKYVFLSFAGILLPNFI